MLTEAISIESLHALAHEPVENYAGYGASNVRRGHCIEYVTPQGETHAACVEEVLEQQRGLVALSTILSYAGSSRLFQLERVPFSATSVPHTWHYWL